MSTRAARTNRSVVDTLAAGIAGEHGGVIPKVGSFREFLLTCAKCKLPDGTFAPYSFVGREALEQVVEVIDLVLGSNTGRLLKDAKIALCGGAQFGKTILALYLGVYVTACLGRNWGYYLPDDDLVEGVVDGKLRVEIIDQLDWLAESLSLGKTLNKSGKAVNRKGAFTVRNGARTGLGMVRGMGKIPTTFSMDVAMEDEKDDIPAKRSKYLGGRMTAGDLRLRVSLGTQRVHGAGQNKEFADGSQGVMVLTNERTGRQWNPEEHWPQICRIALDGVPRPTDPQLTIEGDFRRPGSADSVATYDPEARYYLADPEDGSPLDRAKVVWRHRHPERVRLRNWSFRVAQLGTAAIDLSQIVKAWTDAIKDPEDMIVFCCDRLALPKSTSQAITPQILTRARNVEPFDMGLTLQAGCKGFAGLDTGDRCWFVARETESALVKRVRRVEQIAAANVVRRAAQLFATMQLSALFIDSRPLVNEARSLCLLLNGLADFAFPKVTDPEAATLMFPGGLTWDGPAGRWRGLRCAAVEFTRKPGQGIVHKLGQYDENGQTKFYPIIQASRFETIDRAINEFLTAEEQVIQVVNGKLRTEPVMRLPQRVPGSPAILETLEAHIVTGSQRAKDKDGVPGDYVDQVENHFLLGNAYSGLAEEVVAGQRGRRRRATITRVQPRRRRAGQRGAKTREVAG